MKRIKVLALGLMLGVAGVVYAANSSNIESRMQAATGASCCSHAGCCTGDSCNMGGSCCTAHVAQR